MGGISMTKFTNFFAKLISIVLGILILLNISSIIAFCVGIVLIEVITAFLYFGFSKKKQYND